MADLVKENLYEVLGVDETADKKQAYMQSLHMATGIMPYAHNATSGMVMSLPMNTVQDYHQHLPQQQQQPHHNQLYPYHSTIHVSPDIHHTYMTHPHQHQTVMPTNMSLPPIPNLATNDFIQQNGTPTTSQNTVPTPQRKRPEDREYQCHICEKKLITNESLRAHLLLHSGEKAFVCEICDKAFSTRIYLRQHEKYHTADRPFVCNICNDRFKHKCSLKRHLEVRHDQAKCEFKCQFCGKVFKRPEHLKVHERLHTGERPYKCEFCPSAFSQIGGLTCHRRQHTNERPYVCETCQKAFRARTQLVIHMRTHTGEKPYKCNKCDKRYNCSGKLSEHRKSHDRPFKCDVCNKFYPTSAYLKKHKQLHSGVKNHKCEHCDKAFTLRMEMLRHVKRIHTEGRTPKKRGRKPTKTLSVTLGVRARSRRKSVPVKKYAESDLSDDDNTPLSDLKQKIETQKADAADSDTTEIAEAAPDVPATSTTSARSTTATTEADLVQSTTIAQDHENPNIQTSFDGSTSVQQAMYNSQIPQSQGMVYAQGQLSSYAMPTYSSQHYHAPHQAFLNPHQQHYASYNTSTNFNIGNMGYNYGDFGQTWNTAHGPGDAYNRALVDIGQTVVRQAASQKQFPCQVCEKKLSSQDSLEAHLKAHAGEKPYACHLCKKSFTMLQYLKQHLKYHTTAKPFHCEYCLESFKHKCSLKRHMESHNPDRVGEFKCPHCPKTTFRKEHMKVHIRTHTGEMPYKCDVCEKRFRQSGQLQCHQTTHTDLFPYFCPTCHKGFKLKSALKLHKRIHLDEKPFKCTLCPRRYTSNAKCRKHTRTHTEKIYCDICNKVFKDFDSVSGHKKRFHTGEKQYKCDLCDECFVVRKQLTRHFRKNHPDKVVKKTRIPKSENAETGTPVQTKPKTRRRKRKPRKIEDITLEILPTKNRKFRTKRSDSEETEIGETPKIEENEVDANAKETKINQEMGDTEVDDKNGSDIYSLNTEEVDDFKSSEDTLFLECDDVPNEN